MAQHAEQTDWGRCGTAENEPVKSEKRSWIQSTDPPRSCASSLRTSSHIARRYSFWFGSN